LHLGITLDEENPEESAELQKILQSISFQNQLINWAATVIGSPLK